MACGGDSADFNPVKGKWRHNYTTGDYSIQLYSEEFSLVEYYYFEDDELIRTYSKESYKIDKEHIYMTIKRDNNTTHDAAFKYEIVKSEGKRILRIYDYPFNHTYQEWHEIE